METSSSRVAVVTGAGRSTGIGRAISHRLLQDGYAVVLSDLGPGSQDEIGGNAARGSELRRTAESLRTFGNVTTIECDVRSEEQVDILFQTVMAKFGRVDVLVNNAGLSAGLKPVTELTLSEWQLNIDVMATGVFLCSRAAARCMVASSREGRIVTIASQAGKTGIGSLAAYSAAKFAAIGFTQALAMELAPSGITVNAVCPGTIATELNEIDGGIFDVYASKARVTRDEYRQRLIRRIPVQRIGTPQDIADAVAFLVSAQASFITGEALNVTGGQEVH